MKAYVSAFVKPLISTMTCRTMVVLAAALSDKVLSPMIMSVRCLVSQLRVDRMTYSAALKFRKQYVGL